MYLDYFYVALVISWEGIIAYLRLYAFGVHLVQVNWSLWNQHLFLYDFGDILGLVFASFRIANLATYSANLIAK